MQQKPIECKEFLQLVKLLPPLDVQNGPWISGGCARKLWCGLPWNDGDIDIWFADDHQRQTWEQKLNLSYPISKVFNKPRDLVQLSPIHSSDNAYTYQISISPNKVLTPTTEDWLNEMVNTELYNYKNFTIQLIKSRYSSDLQDLWKYFDFSVCCVAADDTYLYADDQAVKDMVDNQLNLTGQIKENLPLRILKYYSYGLDVSDQLLLCSAKKISQGDMEWGQY